LASSPRGTGGRESDETLLLLGVINYIHGSSDPLNGHQEGDRNPNTPVSLGITCASRAVGSPVGSVEWFGFGFFGLSTVLGFSNSGKYLRLS
jgi:hypothetical protein